ncbi:MAG: A/G-specific adenine glycosylase, partial [Candidatus Hydrogenedentes bacterium]|nr:A/G-specific adenine glycosylase [Candidatus Hydrogenedentota bacterium]
LYRPAFIHNQAQSMQAPLQKDTVRRIRRALLAWYSRNARELPWRSTRDPYAVWVSEIMLQQTRIDQGTPYFTRFMDAFPTVQALAAASEDAVLKQWEGLGYYSRARNLHRAAKAVVSEQEGAFPETAEGWRALPGVGRYTAGAIASIAFNEPVPVLDGNVKRVLTRLLDITQPIDQSRTEQRLWALVEALVSPRRPGDFNQAMMELGAMVCVPKAPLCTTCPLRKVCRSAARGTQTERPVKRKKAATPHYEIVVAAIEKNERFLLGKRPPKGLLGGLWEFPGGAAQSGETHKQALKREIREKLGVGIRVGGLAAVVNHAYSHFKVTLNVYRCTVESGTPQPKSHTALKWVPRAHFDRYAFPKANHKFLDVL